MLREKGDFPEAEELVRKALEIYRERLGPDHPSVAAAVGNLAGLHRARGEREEAVELYRKCLEMKRVFLPPESRSIALALNNLAKALDDEDLLQSAETLYREALDMLKKLASEEEEGSHEWKQIEGSKATVLHNFGGVLRRQGDFPGATWMLWESLANRRAAYPLHHRKIAEVERSLALLERDQERFDEAAALLEGARVSQVASLGEDHPEVAFTLHEMAVLAQRQGDDETARELAGQALAIEEARLDPGHWRMEKTEALLAELGAQRSTTGR